LVDQDAGAFPTAGCAATKNHLYCADPKGKIERRDAPWTVVANARPGTRPVATEFGDHEIVAWLADRQTSEGVMLQAFASIDGAPPVRISEDGAGATSVDVAARGRAAIIGYVDARGAMAPVHARVVTDKNGKAELGKDAVIFLGGAPDPFVGGALGTTPDQAFFVLPIARDATTFGMAVIRIDDPPREDEPVTWAMYPHGLDPAPISVTHGIAPIRIARVVPTAAGPHAARAVELGRVDPSGAFASLGIVAERDTCTRVALVVEPQGTLLLLHDDGQEPALERLRCSP
jgi:hypothetical protein